MNISVHSHMHDSYEEFKTVHQNLTYNMPSKLLKMNQLTITSSYLTQFILTFLSETTNFPVTV